jgi:hypothetical protein
MRTIGITLLVWATFSVVCGLITNWLMIIDPVAKFFVGSPVRWTFWVMVVSSIAITIASILITIYYTYWHNRFVNTPMIIIAIHFYFFGGIAFIVAFVLNLRKMNNDVKVAKFGPEAIISDEEEEVDDKNEKELLKVAEEQRHFRFKSIFNFNK